MTDMTPENPAELLYKEGMKYDLQQDKSPASATLARATFQQAASMGHTRAIRALAHMIYEGNGGSQDQEQAILLLWSAFLRGDHESLEELADMLGSYAESPNIPLPSKEAAEAARRVEEIIDRLSRVKSFIYDVVQKRSRNAL